MKLKYRIWGQKMLGHPTKMGLKNISCGQRHRGGGGGGGQNRHNIPTLVHIGSITPPPPPSSVL